MNQLRERARKNGGGFSQLVTELHGPPGIYVFYDSSAVLILFTSADYFQLQKLKCYLPILFCILIFEFCIQQMIWTVSQDHFHHAYLVRSYIIGAEVVVAHW